MITYWAIIFSVKLVKSFRLVFLFDLKENNSSQYVTRCLVH